MATDWWAMIFPPIAAYQGLATISEKLQAAYDDYVGMGGQLGYTGWQWEVITGGWKNLPEYKGAEVSAAGWAAIDNVPGLRDAIEDYLETGDHSLVRRILEENARTATEASATAGQAARAEIETINGLMFIVYYDEEGNVLPLMPEDFLGEAPVEGLTAWQQAQIDNWVNTLALQHRQLDWQIDQWGQEQGLSRDELKWQKERFEQELGFSREQLAWEQERFLSEIGLSREQLAWEKERFGEELAWERERFGRELSLEERRIAEELGWEKERFGEELAWERERFGRELSLEERRIAAELRAHPRNWIEAYTFGAPTGMAPGAQPPGVPGAPGQPPGMGQWMPGVAGQMPGELPPAPAWLPTFAPATQWGAPIAAGPTKIPSGQAWGKMPWGQREMLGGYSEFASWPGAPQTTTEIGERVMQMLPTPRERGVRWQPAYQV